MPRKRKVTELTSLAQLTKSEQARLFFSGERDGKHVTLEQLIADVKDSLNNPESEGGQQAAPLDVDTEDELTD